jgi:hypothetical protein
MLGSAKPLPRGAIGGMVASVWRVNSAGAGSCLISMLCVLPTHSVQSRRPPHPFYALLSSGFETFVPKGLTAASNLATLRLLIRQLSVEPTYSTGRLKHPPPSPPEGSEPVTLAPHFLPRCRPPVRATCPQERADRGEFSLWGPLVVGVSLKRAGPLVPIGRLESRARNPRHDRPDPPLAGRSPPRSASWTASWMRSSSSALICPSSPTTTVKEGGQ